MDGGLGGIGLPAWLPVKQNANLVLQSVRCELTFKKDLLHEETSHLLLQVFARKERLRCFFQSTLMKVISEVSWFQGKVAILEARNVTTPCPCNMAKLNPFKMPNTALAP